MLKRGYIPRGLVGTALLVGAAAVALVGVLATMHESIAHRDHDHAGGHASCPLCLHFHQHAIEPTADWRAAPAAAGGCVVVADPRRAPYPVRLTASGRSPPACAMAG